jgi:hypothetical protein
MRSLPSGTVTFLFTDVEGSTKLLHDLGAEEYSRVLAEHRRLLRDAFKAHQGVEVDTQRPQLVDSGQPSRLFVRVRSGRLDKRNLPASERLTERERTLILAILATLRSARVVLSRLRSQQS